MSYFSGLKIDVLQDHASRWANALPHVNRISLHQYHSEVEPPEKYRYAIIFELDTMSEVQEIQEDGSPTVSPDAFDVLAYDYFYRDEFKMVYNDEPIISSYKDEWFFFPKYSDEKWPDFASEEPCWQLFPIESLAAIDEVELHNDPAPERENMKRMEVVNYFTRKGDFWEVGYEGKVETVKGVDGMHYIALLIDRPSVSMSCSELYQLVSGQTPDINMTEDTAIAQDLKRGFGKQYMGNLKIKEICLKESKKLQENLSSASMEEQEDIKEKIAKLEQYLNLKERNFPDPNQKKVQANIRNRLTVAYKILNKNKMKELSKHLDKCINPDGDYSFVYNGAIRWKIIF